MTIAHFLPITGTVTQGVNAGQTLTAAADLTEGTFKLTANSVETAALPYNATAAQIQAALEAHSSFSTGQLTVTGGPVSGNATPVVVKITDGPNAGLPAPTGCVLTVTSATSLKIQGGGGGSIGVSQSTTGVKGSYRGFPVGSVLIKTDGIGIAYRNTGTPNTPTWTEFEGYAVEALR